MQSHLNDYEIYKKMDKDPVGRLISHICKYKHYLAPFSIEWSK